ncbi:MAG: aminomethyl-transferring glycine dehydrogenase [Kiloniellales bacterium]
MSTRQSPSASPRASLNQLEQRDDFVRRHIGPGEPQIAKMLSDLGVDSLDALIDKAVPSQIRMERPLDLPPVLSEREALHRLREMADRNKVLTSMIGIGYYGTVTPGVIQRNILENPAWYTAYTPYQAEVSQGRLEALLNYQQMVIDLTGLEIANASLLDEATAAAEAMTLARRVAKAKGSAFFVDRDCHPQTIAVVQTRAEPLGIEVIVGDPLSELPDTGLFGLLLQYPGSSGEIRDYSQAVEAVHAQKGLAIAATDLLALTLLTPPGEWGADVCVGSAQRFGVPMGYGGPHAAFMATKDAYKRQTPGRIIGVSVDRFGRPALRMALQTREQHIRREKATSNICTAQVLLAVIAGMYAVYHGPDGLTTIARRVHRFAAILAEGLRRLGFEVATERYFDTLQVKVPNRAQTLLMRARDAKINLREVDAHTLGISLDETTRRAEIEALWRVFAADAGERLDIETLDEAVEEALPAELTRSSSFLDHEVFHLYHGETEMLRYLRRLAEKDIALDRAMIPLGSCTMKLNASAEMMPVTWRNFAHLHPFAPLDQTQGYQQLFEELEAWLCEITGFDAVSLQPNAGSQGEYAGLLTIRKYHQSRGEAQRDVCLIPTSAHGTNPASAVMAGMRVVLVECDESGNIDVEDLKAKAAEHGERLAALMVTYPSTHGVFEAAIKEICQAVHDHGGQVYMDGANLNALVGIARPAEIGADVSHMNLHKTFCIPHGGGGPGMGPIGVKSHLAPFLPDHPVVAGVNPAAGEAGTIGAVSAAPWGSSSILPISWAYIAMMGGPGLTRATQLAILSANYMAKQLSAAYPVLYSGPDGLVAHECIIDTRVLKDEAGITVDDVAKRLIDYGFHAPTMSWPVAGTMMIEPTESEAMRELDRFCQAMLAIKAEADAVAAGKLSAEDNPLVNAPHPLAEVTAADWTHAYSRAQAAFPVESLKQDKYWAPVGRVDNAHGDRHLVCTCPPLEAYKEAAE